jgi:hypothetical protein
VTLAEISKETIRYLTFFVAMLTADAREGAAAGTGAGIEAWTDCEAESLLAHEPGIEIMLGHCCTSQAFLRVGPAVLLAQAGTAQTCHHRVSLRAASMSAELP